MKELKTAAPAGAPESEAHVATAASEPKKVTWDDDVPDIRINRNWCKGCGICIQMCPMDVYKADRDGKPVIVQPDICIWCERCEIYCPDFAISLLGRRSW